MFLRYAGLSSVFWYVFAWGAAAGLGAAIGILQTRVVPKVSSAREWLTRHRDLGFRYLVEGTSFSAMSLLRNYGVGLILGLTALGYIQAANTLMGPFQVILYGMALAALPEAIRIMRRSTRALMIFCVVCSVGLTLVALAWGITLMVALPRGLGEWLLGPIWKQAYDLVLPTTLLMMGGCVSAGAATYMRALGAARRSVRAAIIGSISFLVGSLVGAVLGGTVGAVNGAAAGAFLGSFVYWWQLRITLRETHGIPIAETSTARGISHEASSHGSQNVCAELPFPGAKRFAGGDGASSVGAKPQLLVSKKLSPSLGLLLVSPARSSSASSASSKSPTRDS